MTKIIIPKRANRCVQDGEIFQKGSVYVSRIFETPNGHERKDYCEKCAAELKKEEAMHFWKGQIPRQEEALPDEKSVELLRTLSQKPEGSPMLHLLVLWLSRKKQLVKAGREHFELLATGEIFHVKSFELNAEQAKVHVETLNALLHGSS